MHPSECITAFIVMATETAIKVFNFSVNVDDITSDVKSSIIPVLRPDWPIQDVKETVLLGGFMNQLRVYHITTEPDGQEAFVVRIFGVAALSFLGNRDTEFIALQLAHAVGCSPPLLGCFDNGVITGYAPGSCLDGWEMLDTTKIREMARGIASYHWAGKTSPSLVDRQGQATSIPEEIPLFARLKAVVEDFNQVALEPELARRVTEETTPVEVIQTELDYLDAYLDQLHLPRAFCHFDLHPRNMIHDQESGTILMIDHEFAGVSIAAYDFAYLFAMTKLHFAMKDVEPDGKLPCSIEDPLTPELKNLWIRCYLERMFELHGRDPTEVTQFDIEAWLLAVQIMEVARGLINGIMLLVLIPFDLPIPYFQFHAGMMQYYFSAKDTLPELCQQYIAVMDKCTRLE